MRILHIITDTNIGGAGRLLLATLRNMNYEKFEVFVAVPSDSQLLAFLSETGATVIETKFGRDGSYKVMGIVKKVDEELEALTREMMSAEKEKLNIVERISGIQGLLVDMLM